MLVVVVLKQWTLWGLQLPKEGYPLALTCIGEDVGGEDKIGVARVATYLIVLNSAA